MTDPLHRASWLEGRLMSLRRLRHWAGTHQPDNTALLDRIDQQTTLAEADLAKLDGHQDDPFSGRTGGCVCDYAGLPAHEVREERP